MASGQFASAHEKLGRNHPDLGLKEEALNNEFFSQILGSKGNLLTILPFEVRIIIETTYVMCIQNNC